MSDDQSECEEKISKPIYTEQTLYKIDGNLFKWTNFVTGWQERYFVLKDGLLSYYRSESEKDIGCRGSISIQKAKVKLNSIDEFRFDVSVGDCAWYLRCPSKAMKDEWVHALELHINHIDSAYGSDNSLRKTGSVLSLGSLSLCSSKKGGSTLRDKINEIETFRDILMRQLETLQIYFDNQVFSNNNEPNDAMSNSSALHASSGNNTISDDHSLQSNERRDDPITTTPKLTNLANLKATSKLNTLSMIKSSCSNQFTSPSINSHPSHQRHHSYSNPQFIHQSSQSKHHKRSFSHNSNNLEILKPGSSINSFSESQKSLTSLNSKLNQSSLSSLDFKGEAINFKATTDSLLDTLNVVLEIMQQKEDLLTKKFEQDLDRKKKLDEIRQQLNSAQANQPLNAFDCGPDYFEVEGPNSKIKEEEFFDALDAMLDKNDQQEEEKRQLKLRMKEISAPSEQVLKCDHPLWPEIDKITLDQLYYARLEVGQDLPNDDSSGWQLFVEEGEMRLYKREVEIDGLVCDPLKAVHVVRGITAHEVCHHFFSPNVRYDWENTLESMKVLEEINGNTLIFHQIHKKVLLAAQRDTLFWSHIRKMPTDELAKQESNKENQSSGKLPDDVWIVCNNSTNYIDVPLGRCLRMKMTVSMTCETYIEKPADAKEILREHLKCKIIYCSQINPGGWAPSSVLRALYKREYPKFLKRFTQYVIDAQEGKHIMF